MKKIRYGILSTAQVARNAHIPTSKRTTNAEVVQSFEQELTERFIAAQL
jgi:hypothetical protein